MNRDQLWRQRQRTFVDVLQSALLYLRSLKKASDKDHFTNMLILLELTMRRNCSPDASFGCVIAACVTDSLDILMISLCFDTLPYRFLIFNEPGRAGCASVISLVSEGMQSESSAGNWEQLSICGHGYSKRAIAGEHLSRTASHKERQGGIGLEKSERKQGSYWNQAGLRQL